jgi:hypothetical protein
MHIISPPCPSPPNTTSSSKRGCFSPPGKIAWQVRDGICSPSHHQGIPSMIFLIWHVGPWHPTRGLASPWKPKLRLFSQNCPLTMSCKDKLALPPRTSSHNIMIHEFNQYIIHLSMCIKDHYIKQLISQRHYVACQS